MQSQRSSVGQVGTVISWSVCSASSFASSRSYDTVNINCPPAAVSYKREDASSLQDRGWAIKLCFAYYF